MKHNSPYPPIGEIKARAQAIGLSITRLAADAGLARSTIFQIERGRDPHVGTIEAIVATLVRHERAQLVHLITLHGVPVGERAA